MMNLLKRPSCIPRCPNPLCLIWGLLETRRFQCAPIDALLLKSSSTTKKILQSHYWITIEQQMILGLFPQTPINIYHHLPPSTIIYHHLPYSKCLPFKEWVQPPLLVAAGLAEQCSVRASEFPQTEELENPFSQSGPYIWFLEDG